MEEGDKQVTTRQDDPALHIEDLVVGFHTETGSVEAVRGVDLAVQSGEALALVGESGSGKSTVALATIGLLSSNSRASGRAVIGGTEFLAAEENTRRRLRGRVVSMIFQEPATALDPLMRIGDQIVEVIRNHDDVGRPEAATRAVQLLRDVGLPDPERRARSFPFALSGGQRQRVVIAMAIANNPQVLIADEPTTALDVTVQAEILDLLRTLARERDMAVLIVTHNMGVVADFADRVAVMYQGELVETGSVDNVLRRPRHDYTQRLLTAVPRLHVDEHPDADPAAPSDAGPQDADSQERYVDLHDISVRFGRGRTAVQALDNVSLDVDAAETVGLVGESGSGKSTIARVALGLIKPNAGGVQIFGHELLRVPRAQRRKLQAGIGIVLQDPVASLDARMSVGDCVAEPLRVHHRELTASQRRGRVAEALEAVRLPRDLSSRAPRELSGGQRQRVSLARALILRPRLLIADEPTSALDVSVQQAVLEVMTELQQELRFACVFVSHDLAVVQNFAQRVVVMRNGQVVERGRTAHTLSHPNTEYTQHLLAAAPVPDPVVQRQRRTRTAITT